MSLFAFYLQNCTIESQLQDLAFYFRVCSRRNNLIFQVAHEGNYFCDEETLPQELKKIIRLPLYL